MLFWSLFLAIFCADMLERMRRVSTKEGDLVAFAMRVAFMLVLAGALTFFISEIR